MTEARIAVQATGLLREFNDAGVLAPADVHVATRLAALAGEADESVALAAALAVRAPRLGHVYVDLAEIRDTATVDSEEPVDLQALPWPDPGEWLERVAASGLRDGPLRLEGSALYLDRYWREEQQVAADLQALLYTVALHRYLRWRLPGYAPDSHLGGVLYLFLRGMTGPDTPRVDGAPCGVFAWRPPGALVEALSAALDRGTDA